MTADLAPLRRALISVSDKTGLMDLAQGLAARGVELLSTGGTAGMLRDAGLRVRDVADVTGDEVLRLVDEEVVGSMPPMPSLDDDLQRRPVETSQTVEVGRGSMGDE